MIKQPEITDATRKAILDGFWKVYLHKRIDKISIQEIAREASVHRSTFYRYFVDIYDLLNQYEEDLLKELVPKLYRQTTSEGMVEVLSTYAETICHLTGPTGDAEFRNKLTTRLKPVFVTLNHLTEDSPELDYRFHFTCSMILTNLHYWYEHRDIFSLQEISAMSRKIISMGVEQFAK